MQSYLGYLSPHSSALYLHKVNIAAMAPYNLNQWRSRLDFSFNGGVIVCKV